MNRTETIKDFKRFLSTNREMLQDITIKINDLPADNEWLQDDEWDQIYEQEVLEIEKYNIGDVWWTHFPYSDKDKIKRRPAIVIDNETIAILTMYVTTQNKICNPYSIRIDDWKEAGLPKESWTRIDKIVELSEWNMDRKMGELSKRDLRKILQLTKEALTNTLHEFTLLAILNSNGQYLQIFDDRWKSWMFPYIRSTNNNKADVDSYASKLLGEEITTKYVASTKHCKYSVSDDVYKIYNHKLYKLILKSLPENMSSQSFKLDGNTYRWMSIREMENDDRIMEINDEVVAFVKTKC